jgi:uncharacterized membrane protein HdeD (DUF308 family)
MPLVTIIVGALLSSLGIAGYLVSDTRSLTALIPLVFGSLLETCGVLAMRPKLKAHAMHGASALALLGVLGSSMGMISFLKLITGGDVARPAAARVQAAMFVICLVFLTLCIRSFREARARRVADAAARATA